VLGEGGEAVPNREQTGYTRLSSKRMRKGMILKEFFFTLAAKSESGVRKDLTNCYLFALYEEKGRAGERAA